MTETNSELELAREFIEQTGVNLFLTGKAGTGKTTFLHQLHEQSNKRMIVTAPTGVAALNAGGVTLHSFFQLPFGPILPEQNQQPSFRFSKDKINIIKSLDLLVIDEISMVRADVLDGIDAVLRRFRNKALPFGGVQLLLIGDLHQLPPVVKPNEWALLANHYASPYFFSSLALTQSGYVGIELQKVYRQSQAVFIELLNAVREERWTPEVLTGLNARFQSVEQLANAEDFITLTTHNRKADTINQRYLQAIDSEPVVFHARIDGDFPESIYPADTQLQLKLGAKVMFNRNDGSENKAYYNGKIGVVERLEAHLVTVYCAEDDQHISVEAVSWENSQYKINPNSQAIEETVLGSFSQIPLRLAWAITIHKSQGLTFDQVIIDAQDAFAAGQTYVALSRCRTLEGLVLSSQVSAPTYEADQSLMQFDDYLASHKPNAEQLGEAKRMFQWQLLNECFDFSREQGAFRWWQSATNRAKNLVASLDGEALAQWQNQLQQKLFSVAEKFQPQLQRYCQQGAAEENAELISRLEKAGSYFSEQLAPWQAELLSYQLELDNQADQKQIMRAYQQVEELFAVKVAMFAALAQGFNLAALLSAKARAAISAGKAKAHKPKTPLLTEADVPFPQLFEQLRDWRKHQADSINAPAYRVLQQKALVQIVCELPTDLAALQAVPGIGPATLEKYGADIIAAVQSFCAAQGIDAASHQASQGQT